MNYGLGAQKSPYDIRTFTYVPTKANYKGGERWEPEYIEDQHRVGICTSISLTMRARKHFNIPFSAEFQYLMQKREYDSQAPIGWEEGSSIFHALKVGKNIGFLPEKEWTHTTIEDRKLPYHEYIAKLKAIPDDEIERLKTIAQKYKLKAYASVPSTREATADAISENGAILQRFVVGEEWWTNPIEPLRFPKKIISGHAINSTNYTGNSFRLANSWGTDWADNGTAYHLFSMNRPTESWAVWFEDVPQVIENKLEKREQTFGKILNLIQEIIVLIRSLV